MDGIQDPRGYNPRTGEPYKNADALALNHYVDYEEWEDKLILECEPGSDSALAKMLGRSTDAIQLRRHRLRAGRMTGNGRRNGKPRTSV